ncbi:TetR/AcrR family transcriptional regulator [Actinokineospora sp. UTMC 2448]|uniref:TetR/AcrR family transcriptional regulator n=1 Tax=Actinokineospora sp. UTMC 2448 TaxID=2268449 RepID=UPI002164413C|nr:TetR/AcrR family transcriptional regulator [Actinokineospora sp. UTMC 2448]
MSRESWITAALAALARGGVAAVAVDPLATELGVTRGSFYWHFADRAALLDAALEWWEQKGTTALIEEVAPIADPRERLATLFRMAITDDPTEGLEAALVAHAEDAQVAPVLHRVTGRRIAYLTEAFAAAGAPDPHDRARVAYATYVGWVTLRRAVPESTPDTSVDYLVRALLP